MTDLLTTEQLQILILQQINETLKSGLSLNTEVTDRFAYLFGDTGPDSPYHWTNRDFGETDYSNHVVHFEESISNFDFPVGESWTINKPSGTLARTDIYSSLLSLYNDNGTDASDFYIQEDSSTGFSAIEVDMAVTTNTRATLPGVIAEIRAWEDPDTSGDYYALKVKQVEIAPNVGALTVGLYTGSGGGVPGGSEALRGKEFAVSAGKVLRYRMRVNSSGNIFWRVENPEGVWICDGYYGGGLVGTILLERLYCIAPYSYVNVDRIALQV